jgi:MinD-like ATPase involved in chromosome partitioning or flagellar assembly
MHDQADQLRRLVREAVDLRGELAPGGPLIVVSGAQPLLGATTIACGLARELAGLGKQVTLVDANLASPRLAAALQVEPRGMLAEVLAGARRAIEVLTPVGDNLRLLATEPAESDVELSADAFGRLHAELAAVSRQSDALIIDAGAGMNPWIDRLWQLAGHVLLVTKPRSASIVDAYAAVKLSRHDRLEGKLQLVVTRCDAAADAARIHAGFSDTCQRFLGQTVKPPALLPAFGDAPDVNFHRSLRLLAADLACDFRALASHVPRRMAPAPSHRLTGARADS